jgi:predicted dehydrogenase
VGTPPSSHFELTSQCLEAGVHVLCEKPFMSSLAEADRVIDLARRQNLLLRVNNQYRFMTFYAETKRRLLRGEFGRLFYVQCWQQMFHPPQKETNWRSGLKNYVLYEFGTHALDLVSFFFDALPETVMVHAPRVRPEYDADVLVHATMRFPGERLAALSLNRVTHAPERYLEMRLDCEKASVRISLGGVARLSFSWSKSAQRPILRGALLRGGQAVAEVNGLPQPFCSSKEPEFAAATAEHLRLFLREMKQAQRPLEAAAHARGVLELVFAGYESARTGDSVRLSRSAAVSA